MEGEANLLDKTLILYGSPMAVGNMHNHRNCPLIMLGERRRRVDAGGRTSRPPTTRRWRT